MRKSRRFLINCKSFISFHIAACGYNVKVTIFLGIHEIPSEGDISVSFFIGQFAKQCDRCAYRSCGTPNVDEMWGYSLENCMIRCLGDTSCHGIEHWSSTNTNLLVCNVCTGLEDISPYVFPPTNPLHGKGFISVYRLRNSISYFPLFLAF